MNTSDHQYDVSDDVWMLLEPLLTGKPGQWGGVAQDNRRFVNGVLWVMRTGAPWRELPPVYGKWGTVHQRFIRWRRNGVWELILEALIDEPDYEWLLIDMNHSSVTCAQNADENNQSGAPKYAYPWMRMICQSEALLQKVPEKIARKMAERGKQYR